MIPRPTRKRKTKEPCNRCYLHLSRCLCMEIPQLETRSWLTLIAHHRELKRTTNTGRLALAALPCSDLVVRGRPDEPLDFSRILKPDFQPFLLYPGEGSQVLSFDFLAQFKRPIQLLVPDGNWRQASKVGIRSRELDAVPRVRVSLEAPSLGFMRKETKLEGMSTLEAIAEALGVLEGPDNGATTKKALHRLYQLKLQRTLQGRGLKLEGLHQSVGDGIGNFPGT